MFRLQLSLISMLASGLAIAAPLRFDCAALKLSGAVVPAGYSGQCAGPNYAPAIGDALQVPADIGFTVDILGSGTRGRDQLYDFQINSFQTPSWHGAVNASVYGIDFTPDGQTLFAVSAETDPVFPRWLGTLSTSSGSFSAIAALSGISPVDSINGFAIDPRSGVAYLATSAGTPTQAKLYTVNLETGAALFVGPMTAPTDATGTIMIALAINCEGTLYAHNLSDDSLYLVDPLTGATGLVGSHGLSANFAQGMDFDNTDGQLYGFMMLESGENRFGRFDTTSAAFTTLANNDPPGEYEGAFPGVCPQPPPLFSDGFEDLIPVR